MRPIHRWSTIAAATTLAAGTLLLPAGVASAADVTGTGDTGHEAHRLRGQLLVVEWAFRAVPERQ